MIAEKSIKVKYLLLFYYCVSSFSLPNTETKCFHITHLKDNWKYRALLVRIISCPLVLPQLFRKNKNMNRGIQFKLLLDYVFYISNGIWKLIMHKLIIRQFIYMSVSYLKKPFYFWAKLFFTQLLFNISCSLGVLFNCFYFFISIRDLMWLYRNKDK